MLGNIKRMKPICICIIISFLTLTAVPVQARVNLYNGTEVPLELLNGVDSETNKVGEQVQFRVLKDIISNGRLLIAAGAIALGEVSSVKERGHIGDNGEISVQANRVTATDGSLVTLTGTKVIVGDKKETESIILTILCCVLFLIMKGKKAEIVAGTTVNATTIGNYDIRGKRVGSNYTPTVIQPQPTETPKKTNPKSNKYAE